MRFNVDKIQEVHNSASVTASAPEHDVQTFDYAMSAPADNFVSKQLWSDDTKAIVHNLVEKTGIASYTKLLQHLIKINSEPGQTDLENSLINLQRRRLLIKNLQRILKLTQEKLKIF